MKRRKLFFLIFLGYCVLMAVLLFAREPFSAPLGYWRQVVDNIKPVPFVTITQFIGFLTGDVPESLKVHAAVNLMGNVIMFMPLGFFPSLLWERFRPLWRCLLWGAALIICVELLQLFTLLGQCDFDDLLLNVIGIALGYGMSHVARKTN